MTGYGQCAATVNDITVLVEVKCLNAKFMDLSLRLPRMFNEREAEVRNLVSDKLERGKVSVSVDVQKTGRQEVRLQYNEELFLAYYQQLKKLADRSMATYDGLFQLALNSPDVVQGGTREEMDPAEWQALLKVLSEALLKCDEFRIAEGKVLGQKLAEYIASITKSLTAVAALDPQRIEKIRSRIKSGVGEFFDKEGFDRNRLEQEIIYYIEKLDIAEEQVRLQTHLDYFLQLLGEPQSNGKKLGFLAQEIGREINTIGSKANDAAMQRQVVQMKEELEKIKEQLNNIL